MKTITIPQIEYDVLLEKIKDLTVQNLQLKQLKVCTGCGRRSDNPIPSTALACCPDNSYVPLDTYLEYSIYKPKK